MCVYVSERERERGREGGREEERKRERGREGERARARDSTRRLLERKANCSLGSRQNSSGSSVRKLLYRLYIDICVNIHM